MNTMASIGPDGHCFSLNRFISLCCLSFLLSSTAVYLCSSKIVEENGQRVIKSADNPAELGITYELCAGIVDKDTSLEQIAQAELLEECGYKVPLDKLERICSSRY